MSAKSSVRRAAKGGRSMDGLNGFHPGMVPCYRDKKRHKKWRYGVKKGARRASRRIAKEQIREQEK